MPGIASLLLRRGADLEAGPKDTQASPLILASLKGNVLALSWLLDHGADIEAVDRYEQTPIFRAAANNSHGCLKVLLARGASTSYTAQSATLLHWVALYGDTQTLAILRAANISDIDITAKNRYELRAMDNFSKVRSPSCSDEDWCAYLRLESSLYGKGWAKYMEYLRGAYPKISQ